MKLWTTAAILAAMLTAAACGAAAGYHTVRKGETAFSISRKYGMTLEEFSRLNPDVNFSEMPIGRRVEVRRKAARSQGSGQAVDVKTAESDSPASANVDTSAAKPGAVLVSSRKVDRDGRAPEPGARPTEPANEIADRPKPKSEGQKSEELGSPRSSSPYPRFGSDSVPVYSPGKEPSAAISLLRVLGALIFVAALAYLSLLALKGTLSRKAIGGGHRSVRVVETVALGANRTLHVVEIEGKRMLIGSTPGQMTLLSEINGTVAEEVSESDNPGFQSILSRLAPSHDRARTAGKVSRLLREGTAFLQGKGSAARSLRGEVDEDAT